MIDKLIDAFHEYLEKYFVISVISAILIAAFTTSGVGFIVNDSNYNIWAIIGVLLVIPICSHFLFAGNLSKTVWIITTVVGMSYGCYLADKNWSEKDLIYTGYFSNEGSRRPCIVKVLKDGREYHIESIWTTSLEDSEHETTYLRLESGDPIDLSSFKFKLKERLPIRDLIVYDHTRFKKEHPDEIFPFNADTEYFEINLFILSKIEKIKNQTVSELAYQKAKDHLSRDYIFLRDN